MTGKKTVEFSYVDKNLNLSLIKACEIIEDSVTHFLNEKGIDNSIIKPKYDALMVVYKHHIHFDRIPKLSDEYSISTSFSKIKNAYFIINTEMPGYLLCSSMLCLMNNSTRFPMALSSINFNEHLDLKNSLEFKKIKNIDMEYIYSQKVLATDIDYSNHANNKNYVKYILNALNSDELSKITVTDVEIYYVKEAVEGDALDIYMKRLDYEFEFEIKRGNDTIALAAIKYL